MYLVDLKDFRVEWKGRVGFGVDRTMLEQVKCIKSHFIGDIGIVVLLANNNKVYVVRVGDKKDSKEEKLNGEGENDACEYICLKLLEAVTYGQVDIDFRFVKMVVQEENIKNNNKEDNEINGSTKKPIHNTKSSPILPNKTITAMLSTIDGHFLMIDLIPYV